MKTLLRSFPVAFVALLLTVFMTSCETIGSIFGAGVEVGIILTIVVIAVVLWLVSKLFRGGRS